MKYACALVLGSALMLFSPSFADDTTPPASTTTAKPADAVKDPGDEVICTREKRTNSNLLGPKICKTRRELQKQHQDAQDMLNNQTQKALLGQPAGN